MPDFLEFTVNYAVFDNVATVVFAKTFPTTSFARVYVQATAVRPSNGDNRSFYRTISCLRAGASPSLSAVTEVHSPVGTAGASTWDLTFAISGNDAQIKITGQNLDTTVWMLRIIVLFLTNSA